MTRTRAQRARRPWPHRFSGGARALVRSLSARSRARLRCVLGPEALFPPDGGDRPLSQGGNSSGRPRWQGRDRQGQSRTHRGLASPSAGTDPLVGGASGLGVPRPHVGPAAGHRIPPPQTGVDNDIWRMCHFPLLSCRCRHGQRGADCGCQTSEALSGSKPSLGPRPQKCHRPPRVMAERASSFLWGAWRGRLCQPRGCAPHPELCVTVPPAQPLHPELPWGHACCGPHRLPQPRGRLAKGAGGEWEAASLCPECSKAEVQT